MQELLDLESRRKIYECISGSPGIHFREIQRRTGMATGSVDYHLHFLHRHGLVRTEKSGRFLRYYPANVAYSGEDKELLSLLRQERIRKILIHLMENRKSNARKISDELGVSPSNLSWYLKMLLEKKLVVQKRKGRFRFYSVSDEKRIIKYLVAYKASFFDKAVDRFIESWELE